MNFKEFDSIPRLTRNMVVTEKIDGTNAQITIVPNGGVAELPDAGQRDLTKVTAIVGDTLVYAGSRNRWVVPGDDNFGFAKWVYENVEALVTQLGPGTHYGEWWGAGIQRRYGLAEKRFSLFNSGRWASPHNLQISTDFKESGPEGAEPTRCLQAPLCHVVPLLKLATFDTSTIDTQLERLKTLGSVAAPGFMQPEGLVVYHVASRTLFKKTLDKNDGHKGV